LALHLGNLGKPRKLRTLSKLSQRSKLVKIHLRPKRKAKLKLKLKLELNLELKLRSRLKLNLSNSAIKRRRQTGKHSRDANWESKQGGKLGIKSIGKFGSTSGSQPGRKHRLTVSIAH